MLVYDAGGYLYTSRVQCSGIALCTNLSVYLVLFICFQYADVILALKGSNLILFSLENRFPSGDESASATLG